jgi:hypothetical protein
MTAVLNPPGKFLPNPKLKLREQLGEVMRFKHFSHRTESAYWCWIKGFILFCRDHPHLTPALSPPSEGAEREKRWPHPRELGRGQEGVSPGVLEGVSPGVLTQLWAGQ